MLSRGFAVVIAGWALTATACAEDVVPDTGESRYSFYKVDEGFLRLDTQTGQVAMCGRQTVGWACLAVPEDRAVLENEIARLQKGNAALKQVLLSHDLPLPSGTTPEPPPGGDKHFALRLPSVEDIDRMVGFVGQVWHRLVEAIANAENQVLRRS